MKSLVVIAQSTLKLNNQVASNLGVGLQNYHEFIKEHPENNGDTYHDSHEKSKGIKVSRGNSTSRMHHHLILSEEEILQEKNIIEEIKESVGFHFKGGRKLTRSETEGIRNQQAIISAIGESETKKRVVDDQEDLSGRKRFGSEKSVGSVFTQERENATIRKTCVNIGEDLRIKGSENEVLSYASKECFADENVRNILLDDFEKVLPKIIFIQSNFRGYIVRKSLPKLSREQKIIPENDKSHFIAMNAAVKIQSVFRGYKARKGFLALKTQGHTPELGLSSHNLSVLTSAAVKIQALFRGRRARKSLEIRLPTGMKKSRTIKKRKKKSEVTFSEESAALRIQRHFRGYVTRKRLNRVINVSKKKVLNKQRASFFSIREIKAALMIQKYYRMYMNRKKTAGNISTNSFTDADVAAIKIQSIFRGFKVRSKLRKIQMKEVIEFIDKNDYSDCSSLQRSDRSSFEVLTNSFEINQATQIEQFSKNNKIDGNYDVACALSAMIIQKACLKYLEERKKKKTYDRFVIMVQAFIRGYLVRKRLKNNNMMMCNAHTKAPYVPIDDKNIVAATKIQAYFRGFKVRKSIKSNNKLVVKHNTCNAKILWAVITLQKYFRSYLQSKHLRTGSVQLEDKLRNDSESKSSVVLRSFEENEKINMVAVLIQACIRGFLTRNALRKSRNIKTKNAKEDSLVKAIRIIQAYCREYIVRKRSNAKGVGIVSNEIGKDIYEHDPKVINIVIKIQAYVRGYLTRKRNINKLMEMNDAKIIRAVILLQAYFRGHKVRQNRKNDREKFLKAITLLQAYVRGYVARNSMKNRACNVDSLNSATVTDDENLSMLTAAIIIQAYFRGYQIRKAMLPKSPKTNEHNEALCNAAILIQAYYRAYKKRKAMSKSSDERDSELIRHVIIIQSCFRGYLVRKYINKSTIKKEDDSELNLKAIIKIQAHIRGFLARKADRNKKEIELLKYVTIIQSCFKGYLVRRDIKKKLNTIDVHQYEDVDLRSIIKLQAHVRGFLARKADRNKEKDEKELLKYVTIIQSCFKGYIARKNIKIKVDQEKKMKKYEDDYLRAVIMIQAYVRSFIARKTNQNKLNENMKKSTSEDEIVLKAVILIQSYYRGSKARDILSSKYIKMKSTEKKYLIEERTEDSKILHAVLLIQTHYRNYRRHKLILNKENSQRCDQICIKNGRNSLQENNTTLNIIDENINLLNKHKQETTFSIPLNCSRENNVSDNNNSPSECTSGIQTSGENQEIAKQKEEKLSGETVNKSSSRDEPEWNKTSVDGNFPALEGNTSEQIESTVQDSESKRALSSNSIDCQTIEAAVTILQAYFRGYRVRRQMRATGCQQEQSATSWKTLKNSQSLCDDILSSSSEEYSRQECSPRLLKPLVHQNTVVFLAPSLPSNVSEAVKSPGPSLAKCNLEEFSSFRLNEMEAVIIIQKYVRGYLHRKRIKMETENTLQQQETKVSSQRHLFEENKPIKSQEDIKPMEAHIFHQSFGLDDHEKK